MTPVLTSLKDEPATHTAVRLHEFLSNISDALKEGLDQIESAVRK